MNNVKNKIVIILIIFFSYILVSTVYKLYIGLYNTKKEIENDYHYNNLTDIINDINNVETKTDEIIETPNDETSNPKQPEEVKPDVITNPNIVSINYNNVYVTSAYFTSSGFKLNLNIETDIDPILLINTKEYSLTKIDNYKYSADIDISSLSNSNYEIFIKTNKNYSLVNKLNLLNKINRAKIDNKLLTFSYDNNIMAFKIEDFTYQYDILIDPGHGGIDSGTNNSTTTEAKVNLMQSLYEKERYEAHGLKVELSRSDDSSGMMMGDDSWNRAKKRGYAIGYNGVLSKIVYSNHQNSGTNSNTSGFELLVPASLNASELATEIKIVNELLTVYPSNLLTNSLKMYSRNLDTGNAHNKLTGKIYDYTDYYATIRLPLDLFNVKAVTYEGAYMSNKANFDWYYNGGWKKVSEVKIKHYVEALGKTYIPV